MTRRNLFVILAAFLFAGIACLQITHADTLVADDTQTEIEKAMERVYPALVRIYVVRVSPASGRIRKEQVSGSGVVVSPDGYVVTNHHVAANAKRLTCTLANKEEISATLIGTDALADIAVLKLKLDERADPSVEMPYATWGDSDKVRVGDKVFAMGSPAAVSQSVTQGIISNTELIAPKSMRSSFKLDGEDVGSMVRWLAHDAIIFGGNSGGPLVNTQGEVIGINEIGLASLSGAIPGNMAREVTEQIIQHGKVTRAWMGFSVQPLPKLMTDKDGALIATVMPGSPAQRAGLRPGDIVTHIEGDAVSVRVAEQIPLFNSAIAETKAGEPTLLKVLRGEETLEISVSPDERERNLADAVELKNWGITARNITRLTAIAKYRDNKEGVIVDSVRSGGPAADSKPSLSSGDIITHVGGQEISNIADLRKTTRKLLDTTEESTPILVRFVRSLEEVLTVVEVGDVDDQSKPIETQRPALGVAIQILTRDLAKAMGLKGKKGVRLTNIYPAQPAFKAGLQVGDILVSIDDERIEASRPTDVSVFREMLDNYDIGDEIEMGVIRGDEEIKIDVTLEAPPTPSDRVPKYEDKDFEFTARNLTPIDRMIRRLDQDATGVWVQEVQSSGWASLAGLRSGDIIMRLGDQEIDNSETLENEFTELRKTKPDHVLMFIRRGIRTAFLELEPAWDESEDDTTE